MVASMMGTERVENGASGSRREVVKAYVRALLASGALRRGSRLPSIVELSRAVDVGKNTVVSALDDLCGEGLLEARERQGFFVRGSPRVQRATATRMADLRLDAVAHGMATSATRIRWVSHDSVTSSLRAGSVTRSPTPSHPIASW
jgi:DNA-binding GntR family transcriptional regulator